MKLCRQSRPDCERGAAAVETTLVLGVLLLLAIGAVEYTLAFQNNVAATNAAREGARVGASAGDFVDADCVILEALAGPLQSSDELTVLEIAVFKSDSGGARGPANVYRPALPADAPGSLRCSTWFPISQGWPETSRDNTGYSRDWIGVEVEFDHDWITDFAYFNGSVCDRGTAPGVDCWKQFTIMHIEPDPNP